MLFVPAFNTSEIESILGSTSYKHHPGAQAGQEVTNPNTATMM